MQKRFYILCLGKIEEIEDIYLEQLPISMTLNILRKRIGWLE